MVGLKRGNNVRELGCWHTLVSVHCSFPGPVAGLNIYCGLLPAPYLYTPCFSLVDITEVVLACMMLVMPSFLIYGLLPFWEVQLNLLCRLLFLWVLVILWAFGLRHRPFSPRAFFLGHTKHPWPHHHLQAIASRSASLTPALSSVRLHSDAPPVQMPPVPNWTHPLRPLRWSGPKPRSLPSLLSKTSIKHFLSVLFSDFSNFYKLVQPLSFSHSRSFLTSPNRSHVLIISHCLSPPPPLATTDLLVCMGLRLWILPTWSFAPGFVHLARCSHGPSMLWNESLLFMIE